MSGKKVITGLLGESLAFYASRHGDESNILVLESAEGALRAREFLSAYMPVIGPKSVEDPLTTREGFLDLARVILERRTQRQFTVLSISSACSVLPEIQADQRCVEKEQGLERDALIMGLRSLGYDQVSPCLDPGDFSFRGEIVDWKTKLQVYVNERVTVEEFNTLVQELRALITTEEQKEEIVDAMEKNGMGGWRTLS